MKKYLMTGIAAIAMCAAFTSCSHDPGFEQMTPEQVVEANYEAAFIKAFGQPSPTHDWGFGKATRGITRGTCGDCYKYDMQYDTPSFPKTGHPAAITDKEREYVKWWFENNPGLSEVGMDIHNFYLQHVWGQPNKPYTVVYERGNYSENGTMDYLEVGDGTNYTHVLDFNANGPGSFGIVYMRNSSALGFGFHATWGDRRDYHNFKLAHIVADYEGEHIDGWYVGLAMYAEKDDNGLRTMNGDKWNYADDWILKIVPGDGEIIEENDYQGRIMAEDLTVKPNGAASDFDFNDVVFDWKIEGKVATIQLRAIGGTLPLTVGGQEVHAKFGVQPNVMVNTGVTTEAEPAPYEYTFPDNVDPLPINIPIFVTRSDGTYELTAERGKVASKINVSTSTKWVKEFKDIKEAYPGFKGWVEDENASWTSNYNLSLLY